MVIHQGQAEAGHYFSLIKDRTNGHWFRFDDTMISRFNLADLAEEAFGGDSLFGDQSYHHQSQVYHPAWEAAERCANAYYLLYERVQPIPSSADQIDLTIAFPSLVPPVVLNEIHEDNALLEQETQRFDPNYSRFLYNLSTEQVSVPFQPVPDYRVPPQWPEDHQDLFFDLLRLISMFFTDCLLYTSDAADD